MALRVATIEDKELIAEYAAALITTSDFGPMLFKNLVLTPDQIPACVNLDREDLIDLTLCYIIENEKEPVGFVSFEKYPWLNIFIGKIAYVYILPEWRGKGLMNDVLDCFEDWAKATKCNFTALGITTGANPINNGYKKYEVMYIKELD